MHWNSDGFWFLLFLLGRLQVLEKAYSCPCTILTQPYCLPFAIFILQVIVNLFYSDTLKSQTKSQVLISPSDLICNIFLIFHLSILDTSCSCQHSHIVCMQFFFCFSYCRTSLFNSVSWMAYNVFYASIPVLTTALDKDLSEKTVAQNPEILLYCQVGRLLIQVLLLVGLVDYYIMQLLFS